MTLTTLICPSCGLSDMLRRLSSIQATPLALSSHDGEGGTSYRIVSDNRLAAPSPPSPRPPDLFLILFRPKLPPWTIWALVLVLGVLSVLTAPFGVHLFLVSFIVCLILSPIVYRFAVDQRRWEEERRIAAIEDERRIAEEERPLWVRRTALWSVTFYCSRCDMVMIPAGVVVQGPLANGMSCHADNLHAALSDRALYLDEDTLSQLANWRPHYTD